MSQEKEPTPEPRLFAEELNDPANYRKMSEPFKSLEEADKALQAFSDEVRVLRNKYKIADVYTIARINAVLESGDEGTCFLTFLNGSEENGEAMTGYAFGLEQHRRQERVARLVGQKTVKLRRNINLPNSRS